MNKLRYDESINNYQLIIKYFEKIKFLLSRKAFYFTYNCVLRFRDILDTFSNYITIKKIANKKLNFDCFIKLKWMFLQNSSPTSI